MTSANIMAIMLFTLSIMNQAQALVEIDAKFQMRMDNAWNKMYFKGPTGLSMLAAHQNAS